MSVAFLICTYGHNDAEIVKWRCYTAGTVNLKFQLETFTSAYLTPEGGHW